MVAGIADEVSLRREQGSGMGLLRRVLAHLAMIDMAHDGYDCWAQCSINVQICSSQARHSHELF